MKKFDQKVGFTLGGFTVGHRATVGFTKAIGTIVGIHDEGSRRKVTVEFDEPQPVDAPAGATATRFELDFRAIQSTWFEAETVVFENLQVGQLFSVPQDGNLKTYRKANRTDGTTTVFDAQDVDLGCTGFLGITCMPKLA